MTSCKLLKVDHPVYKWVSIQPCTWEDGDIKITIPAGFLSDGMTDSPVSCGFSWFFHDWLYATHKTDRGEISRKDSDTVLERILDYERIPIINKVAIKVLRIDLFDIPDRAWASSFERGPQFANVQKLDLNNHHSQTVTVFSDSLYLSPFTL